MIADDSCSVFMSIYTKTEFRRILRLFLIHLLFHCPKYSIFRDRFYRKLEYHLPYIKRLSTLEATKELMNSDNYFVNIQLLRFILSCLIFIVNSDLSPYIIITL